MATDGWVAIPPLMPEDVAAVFGPIKDHLVDLHVKWKFYEQIFATEKRSRELLKLAELAFELIHSALVNDVVLGISRLTDPASLGKYDNLSLERLAVVIESSGAAELAAEVRHFETVAQERAEAFRTHRNKRIAHLDVVTHQAGPLKVLPPLTRMRVNEALEAIRDCANAVERHYHLGPFDYRGITLIGAGETLLGHLRRSKAYSDRVTRGELDPREDDLW